MSPRLSVIPVLLAISGVAAPAASQSVEYKSPAGVEYRSQPTPARSRGPGRR